MREDECGALVRTGFRMSPKPRLGAMVSFEFREVVISLLFGDRSAEPNAKVVSGLQDRNIKYHDSVVDGLIIQVTD